MEGGLELSDAAGVLRRYFGYNAFRPGQEPLVKAILEGRDCLGVMPTGAGKSVCYQVPGIMLPGCAVVVSPLVSLMGDQVRALVDAGVRADFINSSLTPSQQGQALHRASRGECDLLYIAPERLSDPRIFDFFENARVPLIAVDEAHCVSQWGQDFRPAYLAVGEFIAQLRQRPVLAAFTATATEHVRDDIVRLLGLRDPELVVTGFDRPNLRFSVSQATQKKKSQFVLDYVREHEDQSGIVYCSTRKEVERVHQILLDEGICAGRYHAGLPMDERIQAQADFVNDEFAVLVATNAFGMGIDKSNVRYVIHHNMPGSIEAYYQEAGRAGRDGEPSECVLLWNDKDIGTCRFFIEQETENERLSAEEAEIVRAGRRRLLGAMIGYCLTTECLRAHILSYFGEDAGSALGASLGGRAGRAPSCGNCSNCEGEVDAVDVTQAARAVMRCVQELRGRYGKGVVVDVLRGAKNDNVRRFDLDKCATYNTLDAPASLLKEVIELLACGDYLLITEGRFPLVGFGPRFREVASPDFSLRMRSHIVTSPDRTPKFAGMGSKGKPKGAIGLDEMDAELFERLRELRKRLASEAGVPPYVVFSDATLRSLAQRRPKSLDQMLEVSGVGQKKLERYGEDFLAEINS